MAVLAGTERRFTSESDRPILADLLPIWHRRRTSGRLPDVASSTGIHPPRIDDRLWHFKRHCSSDASPFDILGRIVYRYLDRSIRNGLLISGGQPCCVRFHGTRQARSGGVSRQHHAQLQHIDRTRNRQLGRSSHKSQSKSSRRLPRSSLCRYRASGARCNSQLVFGTKGGTAIMTIESLNELVLGPVGLTATARMSSARYDIKRCSLSSPAGLPSVRSDELRKSGTFSPVKAVAFPNPI